MATTYTGVLKLPKHDPKDFCDVTLFNEMADKTEAGILAAYRGMAAHNLLDNSYFPSAWVVNQRGNTTYTGAGYGIDRWRTNFSGDTIVSLTSGVRNTVASTTSGWHMHQILEGGLLVGKSVTAACYATAVTGTLYLIISCRDSSDTEIEHSYKKITSGLCVASMAVPSGTKYIRVGVYAYSTSVAEGDNVTFQWAALYEGAYTADTLPAYQPKGKAVEMDECRRYYKRYAAATSSYVLALSGYFTNGGMDIVVGLPANMRIKPTITVSGSIAVRGVSGYVVNLDGYSSPNCTASGDWDGDWASIYFQRRDGSTWGGTNNTVCNVCLCADTVMEISADM